MKYTCPTCKRQFEYDLKAGNEPFPFCSERCRLVDLGNWLDEDYKVISAIEDRDQEEGE